jgi:hypothetical protein
MLMNICFIVTYEAPGSCLNLLGSLSVSEDTFRSNYTSPNALSGWIYSTGYAPGAPLQAGSACKKRYRLHAHPRVEARYTIAITIRTPREAKEGDGSRAFGLPQLALEGGLLPIRPNTRRFIANQLALARAYSYGIGS